MSNDEDNDYEDPFMKMFMEGFPGGVKPLAEKRAEVELANRRKVKERTIFDKPYVAVLNGVSTEFFPIGVLAAALERKPVTIRSWEDKGIIPLSRYRMPVRGGDRIPGKAVNGRRLYTRSQIDVIVSAAEKTGVMTAAVDADWAEFSRLVVSGWRTLS